MAKLHTSYQYTCWLNMTYNEWLLFIIVYNLLRMYMTCLVVRVFVCEGVFVCVSMREIFVIVPKFFC